MKAKKLDDVLVYRKALAATDVECADTGSKYTEISKMLTPWVNYLQRCNWKSRGVRPEDLPIDPPGPTQDESPGDSK